MIGEYEPALEDFPPGTPVVIRRKPGPRPQPDDGLPGEVVVTGARFAWVDVAGMDGGPRPYWPHELERDGT